MAMNLLKHYKCRNSIYPGCNIARFLVPDDLISWDCPFIGYNPVEYESPVLKNKPWADQQITTNNENKISSFKWNEIDGNVNRVSYTGVYQILNQRPLNPVGRTGISGRGILGRYGPNHAADPVVTRWKRGANQSLVRNDRTGK